MKYCVDCEYCEKRVTDRRVIYQYVCNHPKSVTREDPVTGEKTYTFCRNMRQENGTCGIEAKLFIEKKTEETEKTEEEAEEKSKKGLLRLFSRNGGLA